MANLSLIKQTSRLLLAQSRSTLLKRYASSQSSKEQLVESRHNGDTGITTISLARSPVNSLNYELLTQLRKAVDYASSYKDCKGVILTSSLPTVFSAGMDINNMFKPDEKEYAEIWNSLQDVWLTLNRLDIPTAAAINGSSLAGGCLLTLGCEYRVMVDGKYKIGLNETVFGVVAPKWLIDAYTALLGYREAELALLRGSIFTPQEALKIGLVDEIADDKTNALSICEKYISSSDGTSRVVRKPVKMALRKRTVSWLEKNKKLDTTLFFNRIQQLEVQEGLNKYLQSLKEKKSKK